MHQKYEKQKQEKELAYLKVKHFTNHGVQIESERRQEIKKLESVLDEVTQHEQESKIELDQEQK